MAKKRKCNSKRKNPAKSFKLPAGKFIPMRVKLNKSGRPVEAQVILKSKKKRKR